TIAAPAPRSSSASTSTAALINQRISSQRRSCDPSIISPRWCAGHCGRRRPAADPNRRGLANLRFPADPYIERLLGVLQAALQIHLLLLLERGFYGWRLLARAGHDHIAHERPAALGQRYEAREFRRRHFGECLPEIRLQVREHLRLPPRYDLELH